MRLSINVKYLCLQRTKTSEMSIYWFATHQRLPKILKLIHRQHRWMVRSNWNVLPMDIHNRRLHGSVPVTHWSRLVVTFSMEPFYELMTFQNKTVASTTALLTMVSANRTNALSTLKWNSHQKFPHPDHELPRHSNTTLNWSARLRASQHRKSHGTARMAIKFSAKAITGMFSVGDYIFEWIVNIPMLFPLTL